VRYCLFIFLCSLLAPMTHAGVYGDLEFGDNRETVTRKLRKSPLVNQTIDDTFTGRTGLNGIFQCKAKLAGLICHLYFNWDGQGGLNEITLRTQALETDQYDKALRQAWKDSEALFSQVYGPPTQKSGYPALKSFQQHKMLISHVWQQDGNQSILMGTGTDKGKCFLFIRFAHQNISLKSSF